MSPATKQARTEPARGVPGSTRRPRLPTAPAVTLAVAVIVLSQALPGCAPTDRRPAPRTDRSSPADSLSALEPWIAYTRARALGDSLRFNESLPYFRRALETPPAAWQPYCDYAIALFMASLEVRENRGRAEPVTRSSYERVSMVKEAHRFMDIAESRAETPQARVLIISHRARILSAWGLAWNTVSEYLRAGELDPTIREKAYALAARMRDPTLSGRREGEP